MAVIDLVMKSEILNKQTELKIILPVAGERAESKGPYQVVWMLHGGNGDCTEWIYQTSLQRYAERYNLAVVLPSTYNSFGMDMLYGARYASFLEKELLPSVRYLFPCFSSRREDNFVAGASMGGFGAFRWAMNRPEDFCYAGAFAGAIAMPDIFEKYLQGIQPGGPDFMHAFGRLDRLKDNENDVVYMVRKNIAQGRELPKLYMVCGTEDFGYKQNVYARDMLIEAGAEIVWEEGPGGHSYDFWDRYILNFFNLLPVRPLNKTGGDR